MTYNNFDFYAWNKAILTFVILIFLFLWYYGFLFDINSTNLKKSIISDNTTTL